MFDNPHALHDNRGSTVLTATTGSMTTDKPQPQMMDTAQALRAARDYASGGRFGAACHLLDQIIAREPACGPALYQRGIMYARAGDQMPAADMFKRALALAPDAPEILLSLATLHYEQGDWADAAKLCEKASGLTKSPLTLYRLGLLLQQAGQGAQAQAAFEKAIGVDPRYVRAYYGLSTTRKFTPDDAYYRQLQDIAARADTLPLDEKILAAFAVAKATMDVGDGELALDRFAAANALQKSAMPRYNIAGFHAYVDQVIRLFSVDAATELRKSAKNVNTSACPVFIVGMPRSGSTLVDQILSSHPDVASIGESRLFGRAVPALPPGAREAQVTPALMQELANLLPGIGEKYIAAINGAGQGASHVIDKMLFNYLWVGVIRLALPNAKIIHCVRDPRDIALSIWQLHFPNGMGWAYDLANIGQYYLAYQKMMAHWNAVFPGDILQLRYEDMVAGQEQQTRRLLEFCGLPWDARCLDFHGSERLVKTASAGQVRRPIYGGSVGKWKKYTRHLQPLLDVLGDVKTVLALSAYGLLFGSSVARADLHLDLAGYARSYVVYADQGESATPAAGDEIQHFEFRRDMEMHFTGEKTLDSGLTIGLKSEMKLGLEAASGSVNSITGGKRDADPSGASYIYFSDSWGKFFLGANEGAAYQLQVAAPSADTYVDGMRIYVQTWSIDAWDDGLINLSYAPPNSTIRLGYDNSNFGKIDRATYVTPRWNGLQFGASFAPENVRFKIGNSFAGAHPDDRVGRFENAYDLAARWDGKLGDVKIAGGIGYSAANPEIRAVPGNNGSADHQTWSAGLNLGWKEWSIGGAWRDATTGVEGPDNRQKVVVAGLAWDSKPLHLGATWYQQVLESNAFSLGLADDIAVQRVTLGGWYQVVDGLTLRSTISRLQVDNGTNSTTDPTQWQLAVGTEITF